MSIKVSVIFIVLSSSLMFSYGIDILSTYPEPQILTKEGSKLTLSCSSSVPWFFCLWHSPKGNKECAIQESEVRGVCSGEDDSNLSLSGQTDSCSLHIPNVTKESHGEWLCLLNDIEEFDSAKTKVTVNVGVAAKGQWKSRNGLNLTNDNGILEVMEGDEKEIICAAKEGFPLPSFSWLSHVPKLEGERVSRAEPTWEAEHIVEHERHGGPILLNMTKKVLVNLSPGSSHLFNGQQSLMYRARLSDSGSNISCTISQLWSTNEGSSIIFSTTISLKLKVTELVLLQSTVTLDQKIGIISGVILAIIFIILTFILVVIILSRRKKKKDVHYAVVEDKSKDELLNPIWKPGNGSQGRIVIVSSERKFEDHYHENQLSIGLLSSHHGETASVPNTRNHDMCHNVNQNKKNARDTMIMGTSQQHMNSNVKLSNFPDDILNTSIDTNSGDYSIGENNMSTNGNNLSRPITRTTKTISSASDSSRSSIITDKSITMRDVTDLIDSYNGIIPDTNQERILNVTSSDYHSAPPSQEDSRENTVFLLSPNTTAEMHRTFSPMLHETHFGDSDSEQPTTILHPSRPISPPPILLPNRQPSGLTIFDCELGCFVPIEEFKRKVNERKKQWQ